MTAKGDDFLQSFARLAALNAERMFLLLFENRSAGSDKQILTADRMRIEQELNLLIRKHPDSEHYIDRKSIDRNEWRVRDRLITAKLLDILVHHLEFTYARQQADSHADHIACDPPYDRPNEACLASIAETLVNAAPAEFRLPPSET